MDNKAVFYPIIINGEETGEINVHKEGIMTVFNAKCEDNGAIIRLSVYGEAEGYLGVMVPHEGKLHLSKRLSPAAMESFPREITHGGIKGEAAMQEAALPQKSEPAPVMAEAEEKPPEMEVIFVPEEKKAPVEAKDTEDNIWIPEPNPWSLFSDHTDKFAWRTCRGAIILNTEGGCLLAVPDFSVDRYPEVPKSRIKERRDIEGNEYTVFEIKNGKLA